jgi:purine-binding chemotaxis protein CheW
MQTDNFILRFKLDDVNFALSLDSVTRIVRAVDVTPIPNAGTKILGVINIHSDIHPVYDLRKKLGFSPRDVEIEDHFIVTKTKEMAPVVQVDKVLDVINISNSNFADMNVDYYRNKEIKGVVQLEDGLTLIYDLETFLSQEEINSLQESLEN